MMSEMPESSNISGGVESDTLDYLREVKSSTCLLLPTTPSPTPLDFKHPLSEQMDQGPFLNLNEEPNSLQNLDNSAGDSSSSADSNSVVQDPVSAQLINNISMLEYQTLSKNGDLVMGQDEVGKVNGNLNVNNRKLPGFVNWNWPVIRKFFLWIVLSGLVACIGTIIAMVVMIPTECNPDLPWHQGKVFYEVFPASFKDSNNDGIGDLKGLTKKLNYIEGLHVSAVRLNYIFEADNYPEYYYKTTSLLKIDRSIGTLKDFQLFIAAAHDKNIYVILDLPVMSMATPKSVSVLNQNSTNSILLANNTVVNDLDATTTAIAFWAKAQNVDGFYLKNLEKHVNDPYFGRTLQLWKQMIGHGKIFMASEETYQKAQGDALNVLLSRIDLIDVHLDLSKGLDGLKDRIEEVTSSTLWSKPHYPWVHWNIGNVNTERISNYNEDNILALNALQFALPGTINIFYGDEVGLSGSPSHRVEPDFHEHRHTNNLVLMSFPNEDSSKDGKILPWNAQSNDVPKYHHLDIIKQLIDLRLETPTIYLRSIYKNGNIYKNTNIRETGSNLILIERWYPRRNTCVFIGNFGNVSISTDLSSMFYGGVVIAGTNSTLTGQILYFDEITFLPHSGIIFKLDK